MTSLDNMVLTLARNSLKSVTKSDMPSLKFLAKCADVESKCLKLRNEFAARKSLNVGEKDTLGLVKEVEKLVTLWKVVVLNGSKILKLKTLEKTALLVSPASRAVGEFQHQSGTKAKESYASSDLR